MRAVRILRVEATAINSRRELLRKHALRFCSLAFGAHRGSRAHQPRAPRHHLLLWRRRLAREHALVAALDDQTRRDMARRRAVDARGIDVPVARCRVGIAGRLQRIGLLVLKECPNGG